MKKNLVLLMLIMMFSNAVNAMTYDQATLTGKPILLYISMIGCGACRYFTPIFDKEEQKFSNKFAFAKEDINSNIAAKLRFDGVPAVFIIKPQKGDSQQIEWECLRDQQCFEGILNKY